MYNVSYKFCFSKGDTNMITVVYETKDTVGIQVMRFEKYSDAILFSLVVTDGTLYGIIDSRYEEDFIKSIDYIPFN